MFSLVSTEIRKYLGSSLSGVECQNSPGAKHRARTIRKLNDESCLDYLHNRLGLHPGDGLPQRLLRRTVARALAGPHPPSASTSRKMRLQAGARCTTRPTTSPISDSVSEKGGLRLIAMTRLSEPAEGLFGRIGANGVINSKLTEVTSERWKPSGELGFRE